MLVSCVSFSCLSFLNLICAFFWNLALFIVNRITTQGKLCQSGNNSLSKEMLEPDKCYMLDCDDEIFVWMGRQTSITERKTSISSTEVRIPLFSLSFSSHYPPIFIFLTPQCSFGIDKFYGKFKKKKKKRFLRPTYNF